MRRNPQLATGIELLTVRVLARAVRASSITALHSTFSTARTSDIVRQPRSARKFRAPAAMVTNAECRETFTYPTSVPEAPGFDRAEQPSPSVCRLIMFSASRLTPSITSYRRKRGQLRVRAGRQARDAQSRLPRASSVRHNSTRQARLRDVCVAASTRGSGVSPFDFSESAVPSLGALQVGR